MGVIAHRHAFATSTADYQTLQKRGAFTGGSAATSRAPGKRIALYVLTIAPVLLPSDIARMDVAYQDPLLARHQTRAQLAIGQVALRGAAEKKRARMARTAE